MSIRKTISIVAIACMPLVVVYIAASAWLAPMYDEDGFLPPTAYKAKLPNVRYDDIVLQFATALKDKPPASPTPQPQPAPPTPEPQQQDQQVSEGTPVKLSSSAKIHSSYSDLSKQLNMYLYDVCQKYAGDLTVQGIRLSPLLPLAEANLEGGRVDRSQTFSAMANSSVYTFESVEELKNFNVTRVLDSAETWKRMSSEYWTRDRGALQCNPGYSNDDPSYGKSEAELLREYVQKNGMPNYGTNHDSLGNYYAVAEWIDGARKMAGDRFNVESLVKMFASEKRRVEIPGIGKAFPTLRNEFQVYAIMGYTHWIGPGFLSMKKDTPYAGFYNIGRAYEYCYDLASAESIEIIFSQCLQDIQNARKNGGYPPRCLDIRNGNRVFQLLVDAGAVKDWSYYFRHKKTGSWDQGDTACTYGISMIYGVMQMSLLYSGY